ncbi:helix-turn-helix transcriptional regulator, partial [Enterococcus faecium]|nr:helix-turn-helix transcriptional regulator [Enterococcus faecium]
MAEKLYVSRQAVSNWELGKNYPDLERFCCKVLNLLS